ncbi:MAG: DUF4013 domain-containing protein [Sandaracinaceae bacterium]|nr:DUF4013 domain-containing protein [Sandaracinaceae bacterium]
MHYLRGWTALRSDPEWVGKVGWASLIVLSGMCIPVIGQIVLIGWNALMLRRAVSGQDSPLPRLDMDFNYLMKLVETGFKGFLAALLWSIPFVAAIMVGYCCMYVGIVAMFGTVMAGASAGGEAGAGVGAILGVVLMIVCFVLLFAFILVANMVMQVAVMRAEIADDVGAALRFGEVMKMTKLLAKELIVGMIVLQLVGLVVAFVGILSLYLLLFPGVVIMHVITTYYRAELYRVYLEKGGQPLPIGPLAVEGGDPPTVGPHAGVYTQPRAF